MNSKSDPTQMKFATHLLWMVKNFPECMDIPLFKSLLLTASSFEAVTLEWENQIAANPNNLLILKNAAHFFCYGIRDFSRAERYYLPCASLDAGNPKIQEELSDFYSYHGQMMSDVPSLEKAVIYCEQAIALEPEQERKLRNLIKVSKLAFKVGNFSKAKQAANKTLRVAEEFRENWNYGNAIHWANIWLGLVAHKEGNILQASLYLLRASKTPGSPQLRSFGPDVTLAELLLDSGATDAVSQYIQLCAKFTIKEKLVSLIEALQKRTDGASHAPTLD